MKHSSKILCFLLLSMTYISARVTFPKTIEKRQLCNSNGCNACDGRTCNTCNNNVCCSSPTCNSCVNQCNNDCTTTTCRNNCVNGCTNSCQSQNCPVQSCSQCINRCSSGCNTNQCVNNCSNRCNCDDLPDRVIVTEDPIIIEPPQPTNVLVNNTNTNLVNLTTQVHINNVIHNMNNITIPVFVNTTNINNINLSESDRVQVAPVINITTIDRNPPSSGLIVVPPPTEQNNCCYVLHPRQCYTDRNGQPRCFIRRHRECSEQCTAPVITIENDQQINTGQCHSIQNWPYVYCGNYIRGNCDQCYNCGGSWNPTGCFRQSGCSENCRAAAPSCIQTARGPVCQ